jgi:hypothetical protein
VREVCAWAWGDQTCVGYGDPRLSISPKATVGLCEREGYNGYFMCKKPHAGHMCTVRLKLTRKIDGGVKLRAIESLWG